MYNRLWNRSIDLRHLEYLRGQVVLQLGPGVAALAQSVVEEGVVTAQDEDEVKPALGEQLGHVVLHHIAPTT